ncbi:serine/threonine dehydratase [Kaistia algarum]|uniref:threonine ammonia-lyase n=1 Tax=Kaistia algarum TaxID=2083279 RepID=UPI000CE8892F|nr:pyridoxal-phosphate dependent enzyme [Kaistia algarum]MCX5513945.1 pyridoxal-phosphate dependent enzyme [Kaistia algarum]PPE78079.1 serine/threonine dehydratase [Kaistia algarum]
MIRLADIESAAGRIAPHIRRTPTIAVDATSEKVSDARLLLKLECLQPTGSFKVRGATNKLLTTPKEQLAAGVVTASGGNHGLAVARAARLAGVTATIFVPKSITPAKVEKLKTLGARVEIVGDIWNESNEIALAFAKAEGAAYFHPFADAAVIAGQGTVALELLADHPEIDTVLVAIGGGGLISGMGVALKALKPSIRLIGIEPEGSPTLKASLDAGHVVRLPAITSRVATMSCAETEPSVFELVRAHVDDMVLVSDEEMLEASRWLWFEFGIAADLSGAAGMAAIRAGRVTFGAEQCVATLVCGAGPDGIA